MRISIFPTFHNWFFKNEYVFITQVEHDQSGQRDTTGI